MLIVQATMSNIVSLEKGTCNDRAIGHFLTLEREKREGKGEETPFFAEEPRVIYQPTFDEMIAYAKNTPGTVLFLPHVRADINAQLAYTVEPWRCIDEIVFKLANPPLYLAGKETMPGRTCATLTRLQDLVRESLQLTFIEANNTQDAARQVRDEQADLCVTNEKGVQTHQLEIREKLKEMTIFWMPWVYEKIT